MQLGFGRCKLAQEGVSDSSDFKANTRQMSYQIGTHRWMGSTQSSSQTQASYNANGQPEKVGSREYVWDALGRLIKVREESTSGVTPGKTLATYNYAYTYNHRGERISEATQGKTTSFLYEDGQLSAELDEAGKITRQYIYLAGQPIAVIDTPAGRPLSNKELSAHTTIALDAKNIIKSLLQAIAGGSDAGSREQTTWLHTNHLGAPEAATNSEGQIIWQAS